MGEVTYGRGSVFSIEVSSRIEEPLFGIFVGVPSLGASKYDGGPPLYRGGALEGVEGLPIARYYNAALCKNQYRRREAEPSRI